MSPDTAVTPGAAGANTQVSGHTHDVEDDPFPTPALPGRAGRRPDRDRPTTEPMRRPESLTTRMRVTRAVFLVLLTLLVPGSAQLAAGNRAVGRVVLRVWLGVAALVVLTAALWLVDRAVVLHLATSPLLLMLLAVALFVAAFVWPVLVVDAWRLGPADPVAAQGQAGDDRAARRVAGAHHGAGVRGVAPALGGLRPAGQRVRSRGRLGRGGRSVQRAADGRGRRTRPVRYPAGQPDPGQHRLRHGADRAVRPAAQPGERPVPGGLERGAGDAAGLDLRRRVPAERVVHVGPGASRGVPGRPRSRRRGDETGRRGDHRTDGQLLRAGRPARFPAV